MAGPKKNTAFTFGIALVSQSDTDIFKTSPTLAAGDITVSIDGGDFSNIGTLPTQIQSTGVLPVALTAAEMNGDVIYVRFHDAAGDEWQDALVVINTETGTLSEVNTDVEAILADTGTDGVVLANDAITSAKYDESTAYPVKSADTGSTQIARVGADGDTLETLSDQLDGQDPADVWGYSSRTLTQSAASVTTAVSGGTVSHYLDTYWTGTITGLTTGVDISEAILSVKANINDADNDSLIRISSSAGMERLGGSAVTAITGGTSAWGSLSVDGTAGSAVYIVKTAATKLLPLFKGTYDLKYIDSSSEEHNWSAPAAWNASLVVTEAT